MLRIRDLKVEKAGRTVCSAPELSAQPGERIAVIGPNGCGKTTLLRVASGLETKFTGECQAEVPRRSRVYVQQTPYLFRGSVLFNARYGLMARSVPLREQVSTAKRWLETFGVGHLQQRRCRNLSGGERRRVALARAFAIRPDLLLLDEPLADLDQKGIEIVCDAIMAESDSTIVIASPVPLPVSLTGRTYQLTVPSD